ncbi:MAG: glutamine synthetase family protein [Lachnospiraceae bacterium]|nr:glutamine synthetase family protein [Lachnospiraceae bacterium]
MKYTKQEVIQFVQEVDIKFIRLAFCDVFGKQKNISIMPSELERAFNYGIAIDASAVCGFGGEVHSDLFLYPDSDTLAILPWRPEHGKVVRMYCTIKNPDGSIFENDTRSILIRAIEDAKKAGLSFYFGSEMEFYLFKLDEDGEVTKVPYDRAGYMDMAPDDKGENVRREICLTLEQMDIVPECSHHEEGPGQNEIDFRYSDALSAADNAMAFVTVVKAIASRNGLYADFSPKPLEDKPGNGFHINISVKSENGEVISSEVIAGILKHAKEMTAFLNPTEASYKRLGVFKAPKYISWSSENRSQLIRIPAATGEYKRAELRSADPSANPYLAFALLIYAGLDGVLNKLELPKETDFNFFTMPKSVVNEYEMLPQSLEEAKFIVSESEFIREHFPSMLIRTYCRKNDK